MRILLITSSYLWGNGGGIYASRTHINLFRELFSDMTLLYPTKEGRLPEGIIHDMEMIPVEDTRSPFVKFLALLFGRFNRFERKAKELAKRKYDIVVFDSSVTSSRCLDCFKSVGTKIITIHHNYQIEYVRGDIPLLLILPTLFWTWIYEGHSVRHSDLNITLTQQDVSLLRKHYKSDSFFGVMGVFEQERITIEPNTVNGNSHRYLITGGLGSKQTEDSLVAWFKEYYPILKQVDPHAKLIVAGSNPTVSLKKMCLTLGVELIPNPAEMTPIIRQCDFYVCPTDRGGGLKLRIMDGLKNGLPVITHKISARGYEDMEKQGVLFSYSCPPEFIDGIKQLHRGTINRAYVQQIYNRYFSFERGISHLESLLRSSGLL